MAWFFGSKRRAKRERIAEIEAEREMRDELHEQAYEEAERRRVAELRTEKRYKAQLERQAAGVKQAETLAEQRTEAGGFKFTPYTKKTFANLFRWVILIGLVVGAWFFFSGPAFGAVWQKIASSTSVSFESTGITDKLAQLWYTVKDPSTLYKQFYEAYSFGPVKTAKGAEVKGVQVVKGFSPFEEEFKPLRFYREAEPVRARTTVKIDGLSKGYGAFAVSFRCTSEDGINGTFENVYSSSMKGIENKGEQILITVAEEERREITLGCLYEKGFVMRDDLEIGTKEIALEWEIDDALVVAELHAYNIARKQPGLKLPDNDLVWCIAGCGYAQLNLNTIQMPFITAEYEDVTFPLVILFEKKSGWTGEIKELKELRVIPLAKTKGGVSNIEITKCIEFNGATLTMEEVLMKYANERGWDVGQYFECEFKFTQHREELDYDIIRVTAKYRLGGEFTGTVEVKNATTISPQYNAS